MANVAVWHEDFRLEEFQQASGPLASRPYGDAVSELGLHHIE